MKTAIIAVIVLGAVAGGAASVRVTRDTDYEKIFKSATFSLSEAIDKALAAKEAKEGIVVNAEIEEEDGKIIFSMQLAKGDKLVEINVDAKDGSLLPIENEAGDKSAQAKAAKLTVKQCIESALKHLKGKAVEASLLMKEGKPVCDVKVYTTEGKLATISINAETGEIAIGQKNLEKAPTQEEGANLPLDQLPSVVLAAVKAKYPKNEPKSAQGPQDENGQKVYEIVLKDPDGDIEVKITPAGKITGSEQELAPGKLPESVSKGVLGMFPGKTIKKAERVETAFKGHFLVTFEVMVDLNPGEKEVVVTLAGKLATAEEGGEEEIALDALPTAIQSALKSKYPGAELKGAEKVLVNEEIIFEVTLKHGGKNLEVEFKADGSVVEVEDLDAEAAKKAKGK